MADLLYVLTFTGAVVAVALPGVALFVIPEVLRRARATANAALAAVKETAPQATDPHHPVDAKETTR